MKIDFALEKYLKYRRYVEKISNNTLIQHKGAIERFIQFIFVLRSDIPELEEI